MADYDFRGLSPFDFEVLCHDLLERDLGVNLQPFATGRDGGIDLRHAVANNNTLVVQCKHYAKSDFRKLLSSLRKLELPKIRKLAPQRYILATTAHLTPGNVDKLYELLRPYCVSKQDILAAASINHLLQKYPDVEKANFKLWLTSTAVLERVFHAGVFFASEKTVEQIRDRFGMFVETTALEPARKQLHRKKVCILSGQPGVGKTTLAEILITEHLEKGWQLVVVDRNMDEVEGLYNPDPAMKQLFYYDDFLGQISEGEKLGKNEDRALLRMIETVAGTRNRRFLLTTREYILAQAKKSHERLARSDIDLFKFVVRCEHYSDLDKAKIFANHLFFANVPQTHLAAVVSNRAYNKIINHENYNPRIIEIMTKTSRVNGIKASEYCDEIMRALDNPADIWFHAFENQISEASRHLILTLASCGDGILLSDLKTAFESFFLKRAARFNIPLGTLSFEQSLHELEDSFIRITVYRQERVVSFQNPSVLDFVKNWLLCHTSEAWELLESVVSFEQAERLLAVLNFAKEFVQGRAEETERVCSVLERTFSSATLKLMRSTHVFRGTGFISLEWSPHSTSCWSRILACCQFMKMWPSSRFQSFTLNGLAVLLADVDLCDETVWENCFTALSRTYNVAPPDWYDHQILVVFNRLKSCCLDHIEKLDSLSQLAGWIEFNSDVLPRESVEFVSKSLAARVVVLAELELEQVSPSQFGSFLDILQELDGRWGLDLSSEIGWLEDQIQRQEEDEDRPFEQLNRASGVAEGRDIDNLFQALVE